MSYSICELNEKGIPPLLQGIAQVEEWEKKRTSILGMWIAYIGGLPARTRLGCEQISEVQADNYRIRRIIYDSYNGDRIPAMLLIPNEAFPGRFRQAERQFPAVLALHQTAPAGKEDCASPTGTAYARYGMELAERGFVVLAPDSLTAGERVYPGCKPFVNAPFYEQYPQWSATGKNIYDHIQGIDLLCSLDFVDPRRIGAIGHSFGGYNAFHLAGVDRRIKAVVSSCGFGTFSNGGDPTIWGKRDWYTHLPRLSADLAKGAIPFEFHEIAALVAPTPYLNFSAQNCYCFPNWQTIGDCMHELYQVYRLLGAGERFVSILGVKEHEFPADIRELAYRFLEKWLAASAQD